MKQNMEGNFFVSVMVREEGFGGFYYILVMVKMTAHYRCTVGHSTLPKHISFSAKQIKEDSELDGTKEVMNRSQETDL